MSTEKTEQEFKVGDRVEFSALDGGRPKTGTLTGICMKGVEISGDNNGFYARLFKEIRHLNPDETPADLVNRPSHYDLPGHPGIQCEDVIEALGMGWWRGNAFKYLWRAGRKNDLLTDLKKSRRCLDREISKLEGGHERD